MEKEFASISVLLVDDQQAFLDLLKFCLNELGITRIFETLTYEEGLAVFKTEKPDIAILDIELSKDGKTGIDLAKAIRSVDEKIPIIFMTSHFHENYYIKARKVRPRGFMNKELSVLKLLQAIDIAVFPLEHPPLPLYEAEEETKLQVPFFTSSQVFFKIGDTFKAINIENIDFFFAEDKITYAKVGNRNFPTNVQLKILQEEFEPAFLRCHKKYLVNVNAIARILIKDAKLIIGDEQLPIGYIYRKPFLEKLRLLK